MRKLTFLLCFLFPVLTLAQEAPDFSRYMSVPMVDGRIVFTHSIKTEGDTQASLYKKCLSCVELIVAKNEAQKDKKGRIIEGAKAIYLSQDPDNGILDLRFETPFSFSGLGIGKTNAIMTYFLGVKIVDGECIITMSNISYYYTVSDGTFERFTAENSITDKDALNKDKTKLTNYYGDIRIATIDKADEIFATFDRAFE